MTIVAVSTDVWANDGFAVFSLVSAIYGIIGVAKVRFWAVLGVECVVVHIM